MVDVVDGQVGLECQAEHQKCLIWRGPCSEVCQPKGYRDTI